MGAENNDRIKGGIVEGLLSAVADADKLRAKRVTGLIQEFDFHKAAADAAAATTSQLWIKRLTKRVRINDDVRLIPAAALTADATNNATLTLEVNDGAGGANTVIATLVTDVAGGNWVLGVAKSFTLTAANAVVDGETANKFFQLKIAKGGTGVIVPVSTLLFSGEVVT